MSKILCCIPARYGSTRLYGKPLLKIGDKTIINLVYIQAQKTKVDEIVVLTDDTKIYDEVNKFGGKCVIITEYCLNGTDRIIKYLNSINILEYKCVVNLQGDEPFINPDQVNLAIDNFINGNYQCSTICFKTKNSEEILSKSRGKAVLDKNNNIIYCSRNVIPTCKTNNVIKDYEYTIHVGVFVFDINYLLNYYAKENTNLQLQEDIEWLKIIEQGFKINTILVDHVERGVDTVEDYNYLLSINCDK
jgi:3-deoxy-manno-octulosonate cytidylyltransferase (CMP-KDO synthetase)